MKCAGEVVERIIGGNNDPTAHQEVMSKQNHRITSFTV